MHLVIFGLGYTGAALAEAAAARGLTVTVITRQTAQARGGVALASFDEPAAALASATHLVASAPPEQDGDPVLARHRAAIAAAPALRWIGYMSTTGVYGDRGGGWVDEATDPAPTSGRGQRRVAAERPFAVDVLAGVERHLHEVAVGRHADGDGDQVHRRVGEQ